MMPYTRSYKKRTYRKPYKRLYRRYKKKGRKLSRPTVSIQRSLITADRQMAKLKFTTGINMTSTAVGAYYVFRGNSCYDPDQTGAGLQPAGFDQYMTLYTYCKVLASKITIIPRDQTATGMNIMVVCPRLSVTGETNYAELVCEPYAKKMVVPLSNGGYTKSLTHYISSRKIFGLTRAQFGSDNYAHTSATNPTNLWYWQIAIDDCLTGAVNQDVDCYVEITYYCDFYGRVQIDRS